MTNTDERPHEAAALRAVLDRGMAGVHGDAHGMGAAARLRGRTLRRRRRIGATLGVAAAVAVAGLALPTLAGGGADRGAGVASDPTSVPPSTDPVPDLPGEDGPQGWWSMPAPEMLDRLGRLLPTDTRVVDSVVMNEDRAPGEAYAPMKGYLLADLTSSTSNGPGALNLVLVPPAIGISQETDSATAKAPGPGTRAHLRCPGDMVDPESCKILRDETGRAYGRQVRSVLQGVTILTVDVAAKDGGVVELTVADSNGYKMSPPATADEPPLDLDELLAIAADPVWQDWSPKAG
ncbi:hypothetical protein ACT8ZV_20785 [Nocardioides sp. MAHUQ-72]|uniref:hypothetical protein n=1 Tax=unclassified Nocardioides TaxID=2615069 RepID=UPI003621826E